MAYRKSGSFVVVAMLWSASLAPAAEELAKGIAVAREMRSQDGHPYLLTVTPPPDRGVDPRIFDAIEIEAGGVAESGAGAGAAFKGLVGPGRLQKTATAVSDDDAVDVSGLHLKLESRSAASCSIRQASLKFKKTNLSGHKLLTLEIFGATAVTVSVFPTKGDVDAGVLNSDGSLCDASLRNAGELDLAACNNCGSAGSSLIAVIENPLSSQASYVGGFVWVEVN